MPALFTHYDFGNKVLNNINKDILININIDYYKVFNQGFDNLFYSLYRWNYYKNFAIKCQLESIHPFINNIIDYIINNRLQDNPYINSLIYGFISHYILDTIIHPFINYQVNNINMSHAKIEFMLDNEIFDNDNLFNKAIPRLKFNKEVKNLLNYSFYKTYKKKNIGLIFNYSHNNNYYFYKYIFYDKHKIKSKFFKLLDNILKLKVFKFSDYIFNNIPINRDFFNTNSNNWLNYNYSYYDLYNYALIKAVKIIEKTYDVLHQKANKKELIDELKNISINNIKEDHLR